jgi:uncharacterized protein
MLTAEQVREMLKLQPLAAEGGYFAEKYRSELAVPLRAFVRGPVPCSFGGQRNLATAIYYLLTPETFSAMHRLCSDEIYHFYLGDPIELLELRPDGTSEKILLGQDIAAGMRLQHIVHAGVWQGSRLVSGGAWALLGTTMSPGFDFADFELGVPNELIDRFPLQKDLIAALTR